MASVINKRQQARNERALQDLIRNVSGNERCADCAARNPGWASWSLGIFLCMRCASLHRKLGTHISKVKSLSMDSWASDQVENMKRVGNTTSNRLYNPRNIRPDLPLDADEIDMAMEKYIRQKYQHMSLGSETGGSAIRHRTGSTSSDDHPPPVPPKPAPRFSRSTRAASSQQPGPPAERPLPPTDVAAQASPNGRRGSFEEKMDTLKEMGFTNEKRNATVLRAFEGNVEMSVETLTRVGEGTKATSASNAGQPQRTEQSNLRLITQDPPVRNSSLPDGRPTQTAAQPVPNSAVYTNSQSASPLSATNPFNIPRVMNQSPASIEHGMQNMQISTQNQIPYQQTPPPALFPNSTGNWQQQQAQQNPFFKTFTPPISPSSYQYGNQSPQGMVSNSPAPSTSSNPFLRTSRSQNFNSSNPYNSVQQPYLSQTMYQEMQNPQQPPVPPLPPWMHGERSLSEPQLNPYQQQPSQSPSTFSNPYRTESPSQNPYFPPSQPMNPPQPYQQGPFAPPPPPQKQQQQPFFAHQAPVQPHVQPQQTGRYDKNSILALYNQPQQTSQHAQRSATMPFISNGFQQPAAAPTSQNPYFSMTAPPAQPSAATGTNPMAKGASYISRESIDFSGFTSGRYSPDAFASLSSRFA